jgi:hypothetical protein
LSGISASLFRGREGHVLFMHLKTMAFPDKADNPVKSIGLSVILIGNRAWFRKDYLGFGKPGQRHLDFLRDVYCHMM